MAAGNAVKANGEHYCEKITNFLWDILDAIDLVDMWFQQNDVTYHTTNEIMALLRSKFPGRIISRNADINWPPRWCDLISLEFFL